MCLYSDFWKEWEKYNLAPYAIKSSDSWYTSREFSSSPVPGEDKFDLDLAGNESRYKTDFGMDVERILDSQAFRRLEYKTQMFVNHEGDNYRTRLTHTLEVVMIAKYLAKALRLNSHLVEAIGLGHDLGHAPFGHAGENAINDMIKSADGELSKIKKPLESEYFFCHNRQSLEVVEQLEKGYEWDRREGGSYQRGINLTLATREGIVTHTDRGLDKKNLRKNYRDKKIGYPGSLEAQIVRLADEIAQRTHDLEDGLRSGLLTKKDITGPILNMVKEMIGKVKKKKRGDKSFISLEGDTEEFPIHLFSETINDFSEGINAQFEVEKDEITTKTSIISDESESISTEYIEFLFIVILRLLFVWRTEEYFNRDFSKKDFSNYSNRILKYVRIFLQMRCNIASAANISGFLRGLFVSNAIENSFSNIRKALRMEESVERGILMPDPADQKRPFYVIFIDPNYLKACIFKMDVSKDQQPTEGLWFGSDGSKSGQITDCGINPMIMDVVNNWLNTLSTENDNKIIYAEMPTSGWTTDYSINWLNKHKDIEKCGGIRILTGDTDPIKIGVNQAQIYISQLDYDVLERTPKGKISEKVNERIIIKFSDAMTDLDKRIKSMVENRVHHHSKVERMNVKGERIIKKLFEQYWKHPRIMNVRVWNNITKYSLCKKLRRDNGKFQNYNGTVPNNMQIAVFHDKDENTAQVLLCRRIVDYISGMTDRFIYEEYGRLFSAQKEIESTQEVVQFD